MSVCEHFNGKWTTALIYYLRKSSNFIFSIMFGLESIKKKHNQWEISNSCFWENFVHSASCCCFAEGRGTLNSREAGAGQGAPLFYHRNKRPERNFSEFVCFLHFSPNVPLRCWKVSSTMATTPLFLCSQSSKILWFCKELGGINIFRVICVMHMNESCLLLQRDETFEAIGKLKVACK